MSADIGWELLLIIDRAHKVVQPASHVVSYRILSLLDVWYNRARFLFKVGSCFAFNTKITQGSPGH